MLDPAPGRGATWAAAGMIAAAAEITPGEEDNYRLQSGALDEWRTLNVELGEATGVQVPLYETGTLVVGWDAGDRSQVRQFTEVARRFGAPGRDVTRSEDPALFVGLSDRISEGVVMEGDASLDPDDAVRVLRRGLDALGVEVVAERVQRIESCTDGVTAHATTGAWSAQCGVLATGWSPLPAGAVSSGRNQVRPVRGVTARVVGPDRHERPTVRAFVRGRTFYLVGRPGGQCVLGGTSDERAEADAEVGEVQRLLRDALDVAPEMEAASLVEVRSGLRPASGDGRPFLEALEPAGWAWSTGYYRHGVTLAPRAALDVVAWVEGTV